MKRWAAALGPLAVVCLLTACTGSSSAGTSPTSPGSFNSEADQVVADLAAGNFAAVEAKFDPAMMKAAPAASLQQGWAECQDAMGRYRSHGAPRSDRKGQFDLEGVPVMWAKGPDTVAISFNPNGTIAGLEPCIVAGGVGEPFQ